MAERLTDNNSSIGINNKWSLYLLVCPIGNVVRYVGITSRHPKKRLKEHHYQVDKKENPHKWAWIQILKRQNLKPTLKVVRANLSKERAENLEVQMISNLRFLLGKKLTNIHKGGNNPPVLIGDKNPNSTKRPFRIWKKNSKQMFEFDYIFEAVQKLKLPNNSVSKLLSGQYHTCLGYYGCYVDELENWKEPTDNRLIKRKFKIWNDDEEYYFDFQTDAIKALKLNPVNLTQTLNKKRNRVSGFYACYVNELNLWKEPKIKRGSKHVNSKQRKFKVWNKEEVYCFDYINDAVEQLSLSRRNLQFVLNGGEYSHKGFFACYVDELKDWKEPEIRKLEKENILKNSSILVWNEHTNEKYEFSNFEQAIENLSLHRSHFKNVILGKLKSYKGYKAQFIKHSKNNPYLILESNRSNNKK